MKSAWSTWQSSERRYSKLGNQLPALITATEQLRRTSGDGQKRITGPSAVRPTSTAWCEPLPSASVVSTWRCRPPTAVLPPLRRPVTQCGSAANWNLAQVLLAQAEPEGAETVALRAAEALEPHVGGDLDALAVQGSLHLQAAMASVRLGKPWVARDRVRAVFPLAKRTGERNVCWTAFGPTNVAIFAVSVEVEAGHTPRGLRLAERVAPDPSLSIERRVAFHLEQAKGYNQRQDYAGALAMLQAASVEAPEDIRYRPAARKALHAVVQRGRGPVARQAAQLATRLGVPVR